jgi:hypothetical protein
MKLIEPDVLADRGINVGNATNGIFTTVPIWQILDIPLSYLDSSLHRSNKETKRRANEGLSRPFETYESPDARTKIQKSWLRANRCAIFCLSAITASITNRNIT